MIIALFFFSIYFRMMKIKTDKYTDKVCYEQEKAFLPRLLDIRFFFGVWMSLLEYIVQMRTKLIDQLFNGNVMSWNGCE